MYRKAKLHFKKADPRLHRAAVRFDIDDLAPAKDAPTIFQDIVWTIVGQQLSGKAADTIFERFTKLLPDFTAKHIIALDDTDIRAAGISGAKSRAIKNFAAHIDSGSINLAHLPHLTDTEVALELMKVKGIGPWTVEMILMSSLGRTDIFSAGDLGLQKGIMHLYRLRALPSKKKLAAITKNWSPYRTYAAKILWKVADEQKNIKKKIISSAPKISSDR